MICNCSMIPSVKRRVSRILMAAAVAGCFILTNAETFHHHEKAAAHNHCALCKIAHRTPTLSNAAQPPAPRFIIIARTRSLALSHPCVRLIFVSRGLSPPVL